MKGYDKNKQLSYIQFWDVNNLYGWAMSQNVPVNNFEWIKDTSQFNQDFKKAIMNKVMKGITLVTTKRRRNYLVSEPNYHTTGFLTENLIAIEMKKLNTYE